MKDFEIVNKYMKWEDVVSKYPDRWTVFIDAKRTKAGKMLEGRLMAVSIDANLGKAVKYVRKMINNEKKIIYTEITTQAKNDTFFWL